MVKIKSILGAVPVMALLMPVISAATPPPKPSASPPARPVAKARLPAAPAKRYGDDTRKDEAHRNDAANETKERDDD